MNPIMCLILWGLIIIGGLIAAIIVVKMEGRSIEEVDGGIKVGKTFIPAVNVQVNGYPTIEYGIYFEVLFEDGDCLIVSQTMDMNGQLHWVDVEVLINWEEKEALPYPHSFEADEFYMFPTWESFEQFFRENYWGKKIGAWS